MSLMIVLLILVSRYQVSLNDIFIEILFAKYILVEILVKLEI